MSFKDFIEGHDISFPEIDIQRNDNATIYYTSGSTGKPKGVLSSQKAVIATMFSWACYSTVTGEIAKMKDPDADPIVGSDLGILHCVPLFHVTGSHAGLLLSILIGRKIVLMRKWDAGQALKLIEDEKISDITGVTTQTRELINHPDRLKDELYCIKTLGGGGGPGADEQVKLLDEEFEGRPGIGYELSETNE